jgi:hypothetical protein
MNVKILSRKFQAASLAKLDSNRDKIVLNSYT